MRTLTMAATLALAACATTAPTPPASLAPACEVSVPDSEWIDASLAAWRFTAQEITGAAVGSFDAVFFDDDCVLTSANAFTANASAEVIWTTAPHTGGVTLPDGQVMPAGVASFASAEGARAFFVMSTPSVWRAGGVTNDALGLETMMTGVLLHEGAHVAQLGAYGAGIAAIVAASPLPDDEVGDDMVQILFGENSEFAASVARETELLMQVTETRDQAEARRLALEARELMRARRARWFSGENAYLAEAEDTWLTLEGSGQWVAYQWMVHPSGGGAESDVAMANFARRGRWWSQKEGIALAFAVDRLAGFDWKRHAFGDGAMTLTQMLDAALANEE
ncbi:hypothetical protein [Candidatus Viadribacter manganicus]|uniref:hypothetical protein n=1 Tax=Candidatus Viadribacter manganicus TaxID=1759059 RepID=UPI000B31602F|nr:hypothetical protein [Candidatus Viadribacter manganicus]